MEPVSECHCLNALVACRETSLRWVVSITYIQWRLQREFYS